MPWPTPQDYNEAIQNPALTFSDPELQAGTCEVTSLGLPRPITGNFASVYRLHCRSRDWAVRCFWRELSDMQLRYRAISAHLAVAGLPYTVGFEYQPQGIRVQGSWYPILKMEWVEGQLLNDYLLSHLKDPVALQSLMESWEHMVSDLERSRCAHGDLQHGNVLVVNGELKLVDYDGMFVPALSGMGSHELGQQHYQHPRREATDFGPHLDRFSSWVIYISIAALRVDPTLWTSTQAGDERLLLQRKDYEQPASSAALALLTDHREPELQALANEFRSAIEKPVSALPPLPAALRPPGQSPVDVYRPSRVPRRVELWWRLMVPSSPADTLSHAAPSAGSHPIWVIDHLPSRCEAPLEWSIQHVHASRLVGLACVPVVSAGGVGLLSLGVPAALAVALCLLAWSLACLVGCIAAYRRDPAVRELQPLARIEMRALASAALCERTRSRVEVRIERDRRRDVRDRETATRRIIALQQREETEIDTLRTQLATTLDSLATRIGGIDRQEIEETEQALAEVQGRFIAEALRQATLRRASIPGIDLSTKMRLWSLGVWSAADVTSDRIRMMQHLNHHHLMQIVAWRVGAETDARRAMPRHVPAARKQQLHRRYASERLELMAEQSHEEAAVHAAIEGVRASFALRRTAIEDQLAEKLDHRADARSELGARIENLQARAVQFRAAALAARQEIHLPGVEFRAFMRAVWVPWT